MKASLELPTASQPEVWDIPKLPDVIGTFMGRDALSLALSYIKLGRGDTVLLPVYTCQEVIREFISSTQVVFYDVRPDLSIDPEEILAKLKRNQARMMLITNYFGFLQPYRQEIKSICSERGISLFEDCAHSLLTQGSGETGDLSFYSFRKILPVRDGGGLRIKDRNQAVRPEYHPRMYSNLISLFIAGKSLLNIRGTALSRAQLMSHAAKFVPATAPKEKRVLPLSSFTQKRMERIALSEIVLRRRNDFLFWREVCAHNPTIEAMFSDLPAGVCPLGFPIKVRNRESIESRARSAGIPLSVHWRLDPTLGSACAISHRLTKELLTLPVYPDIGLKERERLVGILNYAQ